MKVQILVLQFSFKPNFKEMPQLGTYCLSLSSGSVHVSEQESEASDVSGILWILSSAKNSLVYLCLSLCSFSLSWWNEIDPEEDCAAWSGVFPGNGSIIQNSNFC